MGENSIKLANELPTILQHPAAVSSFCENLSANKKKHEHIE
jgi:hypothetical protein